MTYKTCSRTVNWFIERKLKGREGQKKTIPGLLVDLSIIQSVVCSPVYFQASMPSQTEKKLLNSIQILFFLIQNLLQTRVLLFTYDFNCCGLQQMGHKAVQYSIFITKNNKKKRWLCCAVPFCSSMSQYLNTVLTWAKSLLVAVAAAS